MKTIIKTGMVFSFIINLACGSVFTDAYNDARNVKLNLVNVPDGYESGEIAIRVSIRESGSYKYKLYKYTETEPEWSSTRGLSDTITPSETGYYILKVISTDADGNWTSDSSAVKATFGYGTANGTDEFPYSIKSLSELQAISNDLGQGYTYVLAKDIDASETSGPTYNSGEGFNPIGISSNQFIGKFHGLNHKIFNLYINRLPRSNVGLFGMTMTAEIDDLALVDIDIIGNNNVGGLVGTAIGGTITSCYSTGSVAGNVYNIVNIFDGDNVGGLVGQSALVTITSSYCTSIVKGSNYVGGLVGYVPNTSTIDSSYSTGNVNGVSRVGGLVGFIDTSTIIDSSYSTGNVIGTQFVGGLVGESLNSSLITTSYSTGIVTGSTDTGGFLGNNDATVTNCYWNNTGQSLLNIGTGTDSGITATSSALMMQEATYVGWDFSTVWKIDEGNDYPKLLWQD